MRLNSHFKKDNNLFYLPIKTDIDNRSTITSVLGLAFRKLDVFGYYKFVTAVKNINLLPNRDEVRQKSKIKFLSGFAFKGMVGGIVAIYIILIGLSFFQIHLEKFGCCLFGLSSEVVHLCLDHAIDIFYKF